jgi:sugar phosphate isomerase/epimerase
MNKAVYAMDTFFYHSLGAYSFEARCEMLQELGYQSVYLTLWSEDAWRDVPKLSTSKEKYNLSVEAVYVTLDIGATENDKETLRILELINQIDGCKRLEVNLVSKKNEGFEQSDPAGDPQAITWLERLLELVTQKEIQISLYPHKNCWLEKVSDAVRLCEAIRHPLLGIIFPSFHWYAVEGTRLKETLEMAAPYLQAVNICGSRKREGKTTIEPIFRGEMDNFYLLCLLKKLNFKGSIGLQGFGIGGDVYYILEQSIKAYGDMEHRVMKWSHWAELREPMVWT